MTTFEAIVQPGRLLQGAHRLFQIAPYKSPHFRREVNKFRARLVPTLLSLPSKLESQEHKFTYRGAFIPPPPYKEGKKRRGITLLSPTDYVIHSAILDVVIGEFRDLITQSPNYCRPKFRDLPQQTIFECIHGLKAVTKDFPWVYRTDITNFFGTLDRDILLSSLSRRISDERTIRLVEQAIFSPAVAPEDAQADEVAKFWNRSRGVVQGSCLSPFMANVYLAALDATAFPNSRLFRYVDDIVITSRTEEALRNAVAILHETLNSQRLEWHDKNEESLPISPPNSPFDFLGFTFQYGHAKPSDGAVNRFRYEVDKRQQLTLPVGIRLRKIELYVNGWLGYYRMGTVSSDLRHRLQGDVNKAVKSLLTSAGAVIQPDKLQRAGLVPNVQRALLVPGKPKAMLQRVLTEEGMRGDEIDDAIECHASG